MTAAFLVVLVAILVCAAALSGYLWGHKDGWDDATVYWKGHL